MKNYNKNTTKSYLMYLDANNLDGRAMSQKLPVNGFEWVKKLPKFDDRFIKNYYGNIRDIFLKQMLSIQNICLVFIATYHFYLKERKSKNLISLFNQKAWLKPYIGMNTELKKAKKYFEKDFFKLMNNAVFCIKYAF